MYAKCRLLVNILRISMISAEYPRVERNQSESKEKPLVAKRQAAFYLKGE